MINWNRGVEYRKICFNLMFHYFDYLFCFRSNNNNFYFDSKNEIILMYIKLGKTTISIDSESGYYIYWCVNKRCIIVSHDQVTDYGSKSQERFRNNNEIISSRYYCDKMKIIFRVSVIAGNTGPETEVWTPGEVFTNTAMSLLESSFWFLVLILIDNFSLWARLWWM